MITYKRILVAVPHRHVNEETLRYAIETARNHNAHLTLFGVVEEVEKEYEKWLTTKPVEELLESMQVKQLQSLQARVEKIRQDYANVSCQVTIGIPFIELTRQVQRGPEDLLILDAVREKPGRRRFMGSTTKHVLRKCPCPVLSVQGKIHSKKILAAVDLYAPDEGQKLNLKILQHGAHLADLAKAELHVIYVQKPIDKPLLSFWSDEAISNEDKGMQTLLDQSRTRLGQLVKEQVSESIEVVQVVETGYAWDVIEQYVSSRKLDMVVIGTVCRTGVRGFLVGNTAETVLADVSCSVLALKPDGFVSTVE